ncbi:MAG: hypothetical protein SFX72_22275 [Isosphaeraceae bacterium]|nr:hypothetical protein [Isosphaeraceae bacterium]
MVPDFYALLEVDERADRDVIETALESKRRVWSSGTRNPKYKHTHQSYLDQIPEIRRCLLGDPAARAAYDAERLSAAMADRRRRLDELQGLVELRSAKGGLTVTDHALLRERATALGLSASDLTPLIEAIPPRPETPVEDDPEPPSGDTLDSVMRRQIRTALAHVGCRDLYEALELERDAPAREIQDRATRAREKWMKKTQVTAEKTAWLDVISYAQSNLGGDAERARYDRTLAAEAEESYLGIVEFGLEATTALDPATRTVLLDRAASMGIDRERADRLIRKICRTRGVALGDAPQTSASAPGVGRRLRCRGCGGLNEFAAVGRSKDPVCRYCRHPLRWDCPNCRNVNWIDEPRCRCKLTIESVEPLIRHFSAAQKAHKDRRYDDAITHLERVLEYAPGHAGARKGVGLVQARRAELAEARAAFERARARRRILAARAAAAAWAKLAAPGDPEVEAAVLEVNEILREALDLCTRASAVEAEDPAAARALFARALTTAADLNIAREGLLRCPPDAPVRLLAAFDGSQAVLRWTPPAADDLGPLSYVVVRRIGEAPKHVDDGRRLAQVASAEFEDREPPEGESVFYAVFSVRGAVVSRQGAAFGPLTIVPEVSDLRAETRSREVLLTWKLPAKAIGARVTRREVGGGGSDVALEPIGDEILDRGLEDDRAYRYRVAALYRRNDAGLVESSGKEVIARPHRPIEPLPPPSLSLENGAVSIRWTSPPLGRVRIARTPRPLAWAPGATPPSGKLDASGVEWLDSTRPDATEDPNPPSLGVCYYTPVTFGPDGLTIGHSVSYSSVPDPTELRAVRVGNGGKVHLRWKWSPRAGTSVIAARAGAPPTSPTDPLAIVQDVQDAEYSRLGFAALMLPKTPSGPWHVAVFTVAGSPDGPLYSAGTEASARTIVPGPNPEVTLSYSLKKQGFPSKSWKLGLRTDPPASPIPPMVLVANDRAVPLAADDGEVIGRFPASIDGTTFAVETRIDLGRQRVRLFADPSADPDSLVPIRICHPQSDPARA